MESLLLRHASSLLIPRRRAVPSTTWTALLGRHNLTFSRNFNGNKNVKLRKMLNCGYRIVYHIMCIIIYIFVLLSALCVHYFLALWLHDR